LNLLSPAPMINFLIILAIYIGAFYSFKVQSSHLNKKESKEVIRWLVEDKIENVDLLTKSSPDTSAASYIENLIIQQLTQYDIQIERMTAPRINKILNTKNNVCTANRANTPERRKNSLFSDPQSFYLTHKLYRFNSTSALPSQLFNSKGEIKELAEVFTTLPAQTLGLAQDISFGNFLDQQLEKVNPANIYYRNGNQRVIALASMLFTSRVDFILALPVDITPDETQKVLLEQYTIAGAPPYLIAHFNCSNSPLGKTIINDINKILAKTYQTENYFQAHKKWFSGRQLTDLQIFISEKFSKKYLYPAKLNKP